MRGTHRRTLVLTAAAALAAPLVAVAAGHPAQAAAGASTGPQTRWTVVLNESAAGHAALARLGATVVRENQAVGVAEVLTRNAHFAEAAARERSLFGVAPDVAIGRAPKAERRAPSPTTAERRESGAGKPGRAGAARPSAPARPAASAAAVPAAEPLSADQWDMRMIDATPQGSYRTMPGRKGVTVGIIDTGVDGTHPDVAPNFN